MEMLQCRAPPGGFNDNALTEIFRNTIPRFKLNATSSGPNTSAPVSSSKTRVSQSAASKPSSPTRTKSIVGSLVGGVAASVIAGSLLYAFCFNRQRKQRQLAAVNPSERPTGTSANGHDMQEVHGDHRPNEIDGDMLLEIDGNLYLEAPARVLSDSSNVLEMPSSIDEPQGP